MSAIKTLHAWLKPALPDMHAARLNALMAAVEAGLTGASVSITTLGRAVSGTTFIKHKIKRLDRLVGNHHLQSERVALYGAMTQFLLNSLPLPLVIIDWSPLTDDQSQQLLRASLPVGGGPSPSMRKFIPSANWVTAAYNINFWPACSGCFLHT